MKTMESIIYAPSIDRHLGMVKRNKTIYRGSLYLDVSFDKLYIMRYCGKSEMCATGKFKVNEISYSLVYFEAVCR